MRTCTLELGTTRSGPAHGASRCRNYSTGNTGDPEQSEFDSSRTLGKSSLMRRAAVESISASAVRAFDDHAQPDRLHTPGARGSSSSRLSRLANHSLG